MLLVKSRWLNFHQAALPRGSPAVIALLLLGTLFYIFLMSSSLHKLKINEVHLPPLKYSLVICTLVKNEALYLNEWLDFHIDLGVDRVVIYDDESSDNTLDILSFYIDTGIVELVPFPPHSCDHEQLGQAMTQTVIDRCERCRDGVGRTESHTQATCQVAAFTDCAARYRDRSQWLAIIDVDEFIFPCAASSNSLSDALSSLQGRGVSKVKMECLKFGTSGHKEHVRRGESLVESHLYRAPYKHLGEPEEEVKRKLGTCDIYENPETGGKTPVCETSGGEKNVARTVDVLLETVGTHNLQVITGEEHWSRMRSTSVRGVVGEGELCCNHYAYKSETEMAEKAEKNHNPHIKAQLEKALAFYNYIKDEEILPHSLRQKKAATFSW